MDQLNEVWGKLEESGFNVSTDTRKDISGSVFFGIKGENFDGTKFADEAISKGASYAVTDNALEVLQKLARRYRDTFNFPIIAIGGSNGKTTTRELIRSVLATKYKTYSTEENLNNHIGVPLSIFAMPKESEIAVFEIGANHPQEHLELLEILNPTHVLVTNSGLDHLEGFGSPEGVRAANAEIIDWARANNAAVIVRHDHGIQISSPLPLTLIFENKEYKTQLAGNYNLENIESAITVGEKFNIDEKTALDAITQYSPTLKRSQLIIKNNIKFILDCYNANPTSMRLALESLAQSEEGNKGIILGDMLELGSYAEQFHKEIIELISAQKLEPVVLVGKQFRKAALNSTLNPIFFDDWQSAREWFMTQDLSNHTILIKGSRAMSLEKIIE